MYAFCVSAASCNDTILNGFESAVDCGGSCGGCPNGEACNVPSDCSSGSCVPTTNATTNVTTYACAAGKFHGSRVPSFLGAGYLHCTCRPWALQRPPVKLCSRAGLKQVKLVTSQWLPWLASIPGVGTYGQTQSRREALSYMLGGTPPFDKQWG